MDDFDATHVEDETPEDRAYRLEQEARDLRVQELLRKRNEESTNTNDIVADVTFLGYVLWVKENGPKRRPVRLDTAPPYRTENKKGTSNSFPVKLEVACRVNDLISTNPHCAYDRATDAWTLGCEIKMTREQDPIVKKFLTPEVCAAARAKKPEERTPTEALICSVTNEDGELKTHVPHCMKRGEEYNLRVKDEAPKEGEAPKPSVFRRTRPNQPNKPLVLPYTSLRISRLVPEYSLSYKEEDGTLSGFLNLNAVGKIIMTESNTADLCESEILHVNMNPYAHQLVPVSDLRARTVKDPREMYYYIKAGVLQTPFLPSNIDPQSQGVSISRLVVPVPPAKFLAAGDVPLTTLPPISIVVKQWFGAPAVSRMCVCLDEYALDAMVLKKDLDIVSRAYGIYNPKAFAAIMSTQFSDTRDAVFVPCHVIGEFFRSATLGNNNNESHVINSGDADADHIRGYYKIIVKKLVPDFLRYFKRRGVRVSQEFVEREFAPFMDRSERLGRFLPLKVHTLAGQNMPSVREWEARDFGADVIPLGCGRMDSTGKFPTHHGITCANAISIFDGSRDFFVLMSHTPTSEEVGTHYAGDNAPPADEWIDKLRQSPGFEFWIYAVSKKAVLATSTNYSRAMLPPLHTAEPPIPPITPADGKRAREEHEMDEETAKHEADGQPRARAGPEEEEEEEE